MRMEADGDAVGAGVRAGGGIGVNRFDAQLFIGIFRAEHFGQSTVFETPLSEVRIEIPLP